MASYVKFELEDGTIVFVESAESPKITSGLLPANRAEQVAEQAAVSFEKSVDAVRKMAAAMIQNIRTGFEEQPEEVAINFGLKASGELSNLVVSRGGLEANYNVSIRWRREDKKDDKKDGKESE